MCAILRMFSANRFVAVITGAVVTGIIHSLEGDQYALRASRIEIPSSITAVNFYRKMGYGFKDDGKPDEEGLIRMEKYK